MAGRGGHAGDLTVRREVKVAARFGEQYLLVTFTESFGAIIGEFADAFLAAHAFFVVVGSTLVVAEDVPTSSAKCVIAGLEIVVDGHPLIEDEAFAAPHRFGGIDVFEVLEDSTFEMKDLVEALVEHVGRRLLTPDTTSAKHRDFGCFAGSRVAT